MISYWIWDMGGKAAYPRLYTLHLTLYTKSDSDHAFTRYTLRFTLLAPTPLSLASNLSPFRLIPCQRQCFDADAKQMQERYKVARVKTDGQFGRTS